MVNRRGTVWLCIAVLVGVCQVTWADLVPETLDDAQLAQRTLTSALTGALADLPLADKQVGIVSMPDGGADHTANPLVRQSLLAALLANKAAVCAEDTPRRCWQVRYTVLHLQIDCIRRGSRLFGTSRVERRFRADLAVEVITDRNDVIWSTVPVSAVAVDQVPSRIADRCESPLVRRAYIEQPSHLLEGAALGALLTALVYAIL